MNDSSNDGKKTGKERFGQQSEANDHTRIAPRPTKPPIDDKTRIAQASDKTRIVPRNKPASVENSQTRIAPDKNSANTDTDRQQSTLSNAVNDIVDDKLATTVQDFIPNFDPTAATLTDDHAAIQQSNILKQRFILEDVLGAGGMGIVYKAKDLLKVEAQDRDPYVAIKVLSDEFKAHPEAFISLQRESRKTQRIAHPNIVNVHDFDKDGDTVFMTMEYLEGTPLDKLIRQYQSTGLPTDDAFAILKDISAALIHAHAKNIIHSDFKPGNIFVDHRGGAKVFDFGIARAVAKVESHGDDSTDKTLFDVGNLGALTPSYASLEMLQGETPDIRDDIYALGCVVYELFTGEHPFNKTPADEALEQNLKPKRISNISKRQWKAIERALAFRREDRMDSVSKFLHLMTTVKTTTYLWPTVLLLIVVTAITTYFIQFRDASSDIRSELEYEIRLENYQSSIDDLVASPDFSITWEEQLWAAIQGVRKLLESSDKWLAASTNLEFKTKLESSLDWRLQTEIRIYTLYKDKIPTIYKLGDFDRATALINHAYRYTDDTQWLDDQKRLLNIAIQDAQQKPASSTPSNRNSQKPKSKTNQQKLVKQFDVALTNVRSQLKCQTNKLSMRNLDIAIQKLRSLDKTRYKNLEKDIVQSLVSCISRIGKSVPERAEELKKQALRIFKANTHIAAIKIVPRDACDKSLAGLGSRGKRAICRDRIANLGHAPGLVVIPAKGNIKMFAIGKYEVSTQDFNLYCKNTGKCSALKSSSINAPATNISLKLVENYLQWLSTKTKRKYRLPTKTEWLYAAKAKHILLDPNRNCKLNSRGIQKGDEFVKTTIGTQNSWGIINYVGNAQEWVYGNGKKLFAMGGSYAIPMEQCNVSTSIQHNGQADNVTGFRVLREIRQ